MTIRPIGIDHLVLRSRDLEGLVRFYCEILGCTVEKRRDELGLVHLRAGRSSTRAAPRRALGQNNLAVPSSTQRAGWHQGNAETTIASAWRRSAAGAIGGAADL
jgi:catechol 2,3-dioxygenase-like lactoylglutathione lyase family enzyme